MLLRARHILAAAALALSVLSPAAPARAQEESRASLQLRLENDTFFRRDHRYTHALELGATIRVKSERWHTRVAVGQAIYTPRNLLREEPYPRDHPYAGHLYLDAGAAHVLGPHATYVELTGGVVGPAAGGEPIQYGLHTILRIDRPNGWSGQLPQRAAVGTRLRHAYAPTLETKRARLTPIVSGAAELTTIRLAVSGAVGVVVANRNLPSPMAPGLVAPSMTAPRRCTGFCVAGMLGFQLDLVASDDIAEADGLPHYTIAREVAPWELRLGFALGGPGAMLSVSGVVRARRFYPTEPARHPEAQGYASVDLFIPIGRITPAALGSGEGSNEEPEREHGESADLRDRAGRLSSEGLRYACESRRCSRASRRSPRPQLHRTTAAPTHLPRSLESPARKPRSIRARRSRTDTGAARRPGERVAELASRTPTSRQR
jgi:hypothetical protein